MQSGVTMQPWAGLSVFRRIFSALGWILVATWLYVHAFVFVVNHYRAFLPPRDSPLAHIFRVSLEACFLSPLWVFAAILLALIAAGCGQRPSRSDAALFLLVLGLIGLYLYLGSLD
jgi:thiosulfate reductase cytochrome b subunit